jgi:Flp pilus assembly protein TadG
MKLLGARPATGLWLEEQGAIAAEFALVLPLMLLIIVGFLALASS